MKKILLYALAFILLCFTIPIVFTKRFDDAEVLATTENKEENQQVISENSNSNAGEYDYKEYNTIKLFHVKANNIEEIGLDEYLYGVVSAEMPASFEMEALKAQAVVARTYTIYKIQNSGRKA